jgi:hypothetical protein
MPVRSLRSSVLVWPSLPQVDRAARAWADRQCAAREGILAIGYFGSYARRDYGPGSDLDLIAIVATSTRPFIERAGEWDLHGIPVPTDLLVYTLGEWRRLHAEGGRFARVLAAETVWMSGSLEC